LQFTDSVKIVVKSSTIGQLDEAMNRAILDRTSVMGASKSTFTADPLLFNSVLPILHPWGAENSEFSFDGRGHRRASFHPDGRKNR